MMFKGKITQDISRFLEVFPGGRCFSKQVVFPDSPGNALRSCKDHFEAQCIVKHQSW